MCEKYCKFQFQEIGSDGSSELYNNKSTDWVKLSDIRSLILNPVIYDEVIFLESYGFNSSKIYNLVFKELEYVPFCHIGITTSNSDIRLLNVPYEEYYKSIRGYLFITDDIEDESSILCINNTVDFLEITKGISRYLKKVDVTNFNKRGRFGCGKNLCKASHINRKRITYPKQYFQRVRELTKFYETGVDEEYLRDLKKRGKFRGNVDKYNEISRTLYSYHSYYYDNPDNFDKCWKDYTRNKRQYGINLKSKGGIYECIK